MSADSSVPVGADYLVRVRLADNRTERSGVIPVAKDIAVPPADSAATLVEAASAAKTGVDPAVEEPFGMGAAVVDA